jgi:RHS repeat-associated protein
VYVTDATDLEIPAVGFPLLLARHYETTQAIDGPTGYGWTSSLSAHLYHTTYLLSAPSTYQKEANIIMPSGARYRFVDNGNGTFTPPLGRHDTLVRNADGTFDLTIQRTMSVYHFGTDGSLLTMADDYHNTTALTYDGNGRLQRTADTSGSGRYMDVFWGADGRISAVQDHTGRRVQYTYDNRGVMTSMTDPLGRTTYYTYAQGRFAPLLAAVTDHWNRLVTSVTYDSVGRVSSYAEQGETWSYTYNYQNNPLKTSKSDSQGNAWIYTFDQAGLVTDEVAPGGGSRHTDYYGDGSLKQITDEVGIKTYFTYNGAGYVVSVTKDYNGSQAVRYDYSYDLNFPSRLTSAIPHNVTTGLVDPSWQGWRYDYYQAGSPTPGALYRIYRVERDGSTLDTMASYIYDSHGRAISIANADGAATDYAYDGQGNLISVTRPANNDEGLRPVTSYGYDPLGRIVAVTDPMGSEMSYDYDAVGRVTNLTLTPPAPSSATDLTFTYSYDNYDGTSALLFTHTTDPNGNVTQQGHDVYGRLVQSVDALTAVRRWSYTRGLLSAVTDQNGNVTTYTYNSLRRLTATTSPDGAREVYAYYLDGLLQTKTDRKNQAIAYTYDRLKRVSAKSYPNATSITYTYTGQALTRIVDASVSPAETHTFTFDQRYQLASETQGTRGALNYTYTETGQKSSYQVVGGAGTTYTYYPDGSLDTIEWTPVSGEFKYTYNLRGQYEQVLFPNGQQRDYSYDELGRLTQIANLSPTAANLATYTYGYDIDNLTGQPGMLGQRTSMSTDVPAQGLTAAAAKYYYDRNYRLVRVDYPTAAPFSGEMDLWSYDGIGNRTSSTVNGATVPFTYQKIGTNVNAWQRLLSDGTNNYGYDANGSVEAYTGPNSSYTFTWDYEHRISAVAGSTAANYSYDYQGRRIAKRVNAQTTTTYIYNSRNLITELGLASSEYLFGPRIDEPLARYENGAVWYYSVDGLGSVSVLGGSDGTVQQSYVFDVWGRERSRSGTVLNPFGYTARELGDFGSTEFYRARIYDASTGRFLSEDPLRFQAGPSLYSYVRGNPVSLKDPLGYGDILDFPGGHPVRPPGSGPATEGAPPGDVEFGPYDWYKPAPEPPPAEPEWGPRPVPDLPELPPTPPPAPPEPWWVPFIPKWIPEICPIIIPNPCRVDPNFPLCPGAMRSGASSA